MFEPFIGVLQTVESVELVLFSMVQRRRFRGKLIMTRRSFVYFRVSNDQVQGFRHVMILKFLSIFRVSFVQAFHTTIVPFGAFQISIAFVKFEIVHNSVLRCRSDVFCCFDTTLDVSHIVRYSISFPVQGFLRIRHIRNMV